jgi:hypothetical protein
MYYKYAALVLAIISVAALFSGCGRGKNYTPAQASTPEAARQTLTAALDAWKSGTDKQSLAKRPAALYVGDEDWSSGMRLSDYSLLDQGEQFGPSVRFVVDLQLTAANGAAARKRARYVVGVNPVQSVMRDDAID